MSYSQVCYILRQMNYKRLKPCPISGLGDKKKQESFKLTLSLQKEETDVDF